MPPQYPVRACNIKAKTIWISSSSDSEEEAGLGVGRISSPKSTSKEKLPTLLSSNPPPVLLREAQAHISPISAKEAISTSSQEDSPVETSHNKIDIDPAGDMYLMIEDKDSKPDTPESTKTRTSFRVNSHIISLASRVLAARISFSASPSRSQSQTPKQPLYIELTDDNTDPEALSFILNLLHHRHVEINVPTDLAESLEKLYSIARISSKFKLNGCETLKLWAQKWVSSIGGGNVEKKLLELAKWERALDVAYVFGLGGLREKASNKVIYFSEMEEGGELVVKGRKVGTLLPDAVKGR